jgi:hypothetical protein
MNTVGLAVFVKTPGRSLLKTRLWPDLGQEGAEDFFRRSSRAVRSVVDRAKLRTGLLQPHWAVAEPSALDDACWANWPRLLQVEGGLGARMAGIYQQLQAKHGAAILLGADAPQLRPSSLIRAVRVLLNADPQLLIGRASDGGFWMFGGNVELAPALWEQVSYSNADTAQQFMAVMGAQAGFKQSLSLTDVDRLSDFPAVITELTALRRLTSAQRQLLRWMQHTHQAQAPSPSPTT